MSTDLEKLKQKLLAETCCLFTLPNLSDPKMVSIAELARLVSAHDGSFLLKLALYIRQEMNLRSVANYLLALAVDIQACLPFYRSYYRSTIRLPSDWIDVATTYMVLPDRKLKGKSIPNCLRKAMVEKFPDFDVYQLSKYNKERSIKKKRKKIKMSGRENKSKPLISLGEMCKKLHISYPHYVVLSLLKKRYPANIEEFKKSGMSGYFDRHRAGKIMKLPIPETWETALAAKGNKSSTWQYLIDKNKLPFMAMVRNIKNLLCTGVHPKYHRWVQNKLRNEKAIISSRMLPINLYTAIGQIPSSEREYKKIITGAEAREKLKEKREKSKKKGGNPAIIKIKKFDPTHVPTKKDFSAYRSALSAAVEISITHNLSPIHGTTLVIVDNCEGTLTKDEIEELKLPGCFTDECQMNALLADMCIRGSEKAKLLELQVDGICGPDQKDGKLMNEFFYGSNRKTI